MTPKQNHWVTLETVRLRIRPYRLEIDEENSTSLYGDARVTTWFDHGQPRTKEETLKMVHRMGLLAFNSNTYTGLFTVLTKRDEQFVGHCDIMPTKEPGELEIGSIVRAEMQSCGLGTEIAFALQAYFLELLAQKVIINGHVLHQVIATVHPNNIASTRLLQKIGFEQTDTIEKYGSVRNKMTRRLA